MKKLGTLLLTLTALFLANSSPGLAASDRCDSRCNSRSNYCQDEYLQVLGTGVCRGHYSGGGNVFDFQGDSLRQTSCHHSIVYEGGRVQVLSDTSVYSSSVLVRVSYNPVGGDSNAAAAIGCEGYIRSECVSR